MSLHVKFQPFAMVPENTAEAFRRFEHMETKGAEVTFSLGGPSESVRHQRAGALAFGLLPIMNAPWSRKEISFMS